jgi:xylose isomerase
MDKFVANRYSSWSKGIGKKIESGKVTLAQLDAYAQGIKGSGASAPAARNCSKT